jgi:hypothetical protein
VEDAFEIAIPIEDTAQLDSPRRLIDYLTTRLVQASDGPPLLQTVFYRLRSALADELQIAPSRIRPDTKIEDIAGARMTHDVLSAAALRLGLRPRDVTHAPRAQLACKTSARTGALMR